MTDHLAEPQPMPTYRVVITPGAYQFDNVGDIAMCRVVADRVWAARPGAEVRIYAASQQLLDEHGLAAATALDEQGWRTWTGLVRRWTRRAGVGSAIGRAPTRRPRRFLQVAQALRRVRGAGAVEEWFDQLADADRIIICGQGSIHDGSDRRCERLAALISTAQALGTPTVAVGQGIGPLSDGALAELMAGSLRQLHALGVRESWGSAPTLERLGIDAGSWVLTGDDAVALAVDRGLGSPGEHLGISLRRNRASRSPAGTPEAVGAAAGTALPGTPLELLTMMEQPPEVSDRALLDQVRPEPSTDRTLRTLSVDDVLDGLARCRVVVSGTYHAAVFAQALGIPVICLAHTDYYRQKMHGVLGQFGDQGGEVLDPGSASFETDLAGALHRWWDAAPRVRAGLRAEAVAQAEASEALLRAAL